MEPLSLVLHGSPVAAVGPPTGGAKAEQHGATAAPPFAGSPKRNAFQGPCYLKMLVSNLVAGSVIGRNGAVIASIESVTGASMKLSPTNAFFPGTTDRVVVMSGALEHVTAAMGVILEKISEVGAVQLGDSRNGQQGGGHPAVPREVELTCKIVVPKSAVSGIIGKAGQQIKQLQETSGAKVQVSQRESGLNERVVSITGIAHQVVDAANQIASIVQEDANLKDNMYVLYPVSPVAAAGACRGVPLGYTAGYGLLAGGVAPYAYSLAHFGQQGSSPTGQASAAELEQLMTEQCEIQLEVPDTFVGPVIGKAGIHLSDIVRSTGAMVKLSQKGDFVPGTSNRRVTITGPVAAVHRAHTRLLLRLKEACQAQPARLHGSGAASPATGSPQPGGPVSPASQPQGGQGASTVASSAAAGQQLAVGSPAAYMHQHAAHAVAGGFGPALPAAGGAASAGPGSVGGFSGGSGPYLPYRQHQQPYGQAGYPF